MSSEGCVIGWDVGGAHLKACRLEGGQVADVAQWATPLWQGLEHLDQALTAARERWPELAGARHALTMTAEMTDYFDDREAGVAAVADFLAVRLGPQLRLFAGAAGWAPAGQAALLWRDIASANWLASAQWIARRQSDAVLLDIGSTTTDIVPIRGGAPAPAANTDFERLERGELVYLGAVRTPLCALAQRMPFAGREINVMNEFFATSADIFRLDGELDPAHDQYPAADGGAKDGAGTCRRLARMIGLDARDASPAAWEEFARAWQARLLAVIAANLARVLERAELPPDAPIVGAGCGAFLARRLAAQLGRDFRAFHTLAEAPAPLAAWANTCAPSVAVALLHAAELRRCG